METLEKGAKYAQTNSQQKTLRRSNWKQFHKT